MSSQSKKDIAVKSWNDVHDVMMIKFNNEFKPNLKYLFTTYQPTIPENVIDVILSYLTPTLQTLSSFWHIEETLTINIEDLDLENLTKSKMGGYPYLHPNENWPKCNENTNKCHRNLYLFLQLNMNQLPSKFLNEHLPLNYYKNYYKDHLFQLFHCLNPECMIFGKGWDSNSKIYKLRFIKIKSKEHKNKIYLKEEMKIIQKEFELRKSNPTQYDFYFNRFHFNEYLITKWRLNDNMDSPYWAEYSSINSGVFTISNFPNNVIKFTDYQSPISCDKLCGYFNWRQPDCIYPKCSICGWSMDIRLFQMFGYKFGWQFTREGIGLITICPNHPYQLSFQTTF